ncbi:hypothetical protein [Halococcus sp. IIIV-5B]|uniref:hypothetical protein n=1 Tax=Halococcus sp. IIIV-5B TaxID=2321230 RepID=UPI000E764C06|nr:hypothetical protein [Halococcus sp. IIIV-5B]RJT07448.1 hypothetical protein D3261_02220 [Halococcus sp. IIIV-5B]
MRWNPTGATWDRLQNDDDEPRWLIVLFAAFVLIFGSVLAFSVATGGAAGNIAEQSLSPAPDYTPPNNSSDYPVVEMYPANKTVVAYVPVASATECHRPSLGTVEYGINDQDQRALYIEIGQSIPTNAPNRCGANNTAPKSPYRAAITMEDEMPRNVTVETYR